jgi:hypothetical protein
VKKTHSEQAPLYPRIVSRFFSKKATCGHLQSPIDLVGLLTCAICNVSFLAYSNIRATSKPFLLVESVVALDMAD